MNYKNVFLIAGCGIALSLGQANAQSQTFNATGSGATGTIQTFTVPPCVTTITVEAFGAQGGASGGLGAQITGTFSEPSGTVLDILVGQAGGSNDASHGSGGGGSFVVLASNDTILVIAGGGGGHGSGGIDATSNGSATRAGQSPAGSGTPATGGGGGAAASGAAGGVGCNIGDPSGGSDWAAGGGGFCGNGGIYNSGATLGGYSFLNGGDGGPAGPTGGVAPGGYGCGGGNGDRGAGGGGYSGGAGGDQNSLGGGGGGSYNAGTNQINNSGIQSGNGQVIITWTVPATLTATGNVIENVTCNGGDTGRAYAVITGGGTPYTYSWTPSGGSGDTASGLTAGTYTLTVTDPCAQTATTTVSITQPTPLVVSASVTANDSCHGEADGSASSTVSGGAGSYVYSWTGGGTNSTVSGLTAGTYTLSVQDANGCTGTATVAITQPAALAIVPNSSPDNGGNDGKAWVSVSGGVSPYSYLWTGGNTTDSISGKDSGMYCCRITDANGCKDSVCIAIGSTLGIGNIASGSRQIMVYPNPNNGQFTIQSSVGSGQLSVEVYNVLGEKVFSGNLNPGNNTINMSNQSNGIYLYRVMSENGTLVSEGKITLQK